MTPTSLHLSPPCLNALSFHIFHYLTIMFLKYLHDLPVHGIWADLTDTENQDWSCNGKPQCLHHHTHLFRGSGNQRGPLWPPECLVPALANNSSEEAFIKSGLKISGVEWHPCQVIINLKSVYLSVSWYLYIPSLI